MIRFLQTPSPLKKIVLGGMLLVICAAMVITLIPGGIGSSMGLTGPGQGIVAKVGGEDVTVPEVQQQARQMIQQQFPRGGAQASMLMPYFAQQAAQNLISEKALTVEAQKMGLKATDEEVRDELQHGKYSQTFFPGGTFIGQTAYENLLGEHELTVAAFEKAIKEELIFAKLRNLVAGSAAVTDTEIREQFEKTGTKVKFDYAVLTKDDITKGLHPSDVELAAFYERNRAQYANSVPEKRKLKYVVLDTSKLDAQAAVNQEDLQAYYNQHREEFRVPEQVNVRHILIKTPAPGADGKIDPRAVDEARNKAADILKQLKAGGDFAELAKKYSEDPGSGKEGGTLGWIGKGRTVPPFEKAAFSLSKGGTSDLVQSSFGFHIIRVDDQHEAHLKTLDEVRAQIEPVVKQQKSLQAAAAESNALLAEARSSSLEKAAASKGLQVVDTDYVTRTDSLPGVTNSAQFLEAVFNERDKSHLDQTQLSQGFALFEVADIKPPATPTFLEIRSRVEEDFKNERAGTLLSQKTQELSDRAKAGHDLKKAAKELGASYKSSDLVLPDSQVPDLGSMSGQASVAFTLKPGDISGPISTGAGGVVLAITDRQQPTDQDFTAKKDQIRDSLTQAKKNQIFDLFVTNLRAQMEKSGSIKLNQKEMDALTKGGPGQPGA